MLKDKNLFGGVFSLICYALFIGACIFADSLVAKADVPVQDQVRSIVSEASPINIPTIKIIAGTESKSQDKTLLTCTGDWQGVGSISIGNWYTGGEYYAVYQDPVETGCTNTYPFGVESVSWHVQNLTGGSITLDIAPVIYTADMSSPTCPKPGVVCCRGPLYSVELPNPGSYTIILPLGDTCCVPGPYFAGVECPTFIGTGLLGIITDSAGVGGGLFPQRVCANYNNYRGFWEDLIVDYSFSGNLRLWSDGINSDENSCDACVGNPAIEAGVDLWQTPDDGNTVDSNFTATPIPADFFGPGSDPFTEPIQLMGLPLVTNPLGILGETDAIVERLAPATLPAIGSTDVIDIKILALSLVSSQPITVTYNGGMFSELWDVHVCLSEIVPQQPGSMTITRTCCNGGTFTSNLPVSPKFIFTRQSDGQIGVLDLGGMMPPIDFSAQNGFWSEDISAPFDLVTSPGLIHIDHDCSQNTSDIVINPSSKFTAGMRTIPCDPNNPNSPCVGKVLTHEQAALSAHGVLPVQEADIAEGACCLPDGDCVITAQECCEVINSGTYLGDYSSCEPEPCSQSCCVGIRGNIDGIGEEGSEIDIADLVYFVDYAFSQPPGPEPPCLDEADVNGDSSIDIADIVYMVDYMFSQPPGPEPIACAK